MREKRKKEREREREIARFLFLGTIDLCNIIPFSVALTLAEGQMTSGNQNLLGSFFSHTSQLIRTTSDVEMKPFKLIMLMPL